MAERFPDGFRCWAEDLWWGLTHRTGFEKNWRARWRYTLRTACCGAGFHWPIEYWAQESLCSFEPPEPGWACATCGYERLPYRAWAWTPRWWWPPHWRYWLHDRVGAGSEGEDK